jgi:hypothetical protein
MNIYLRGVCAEAENVGQMHRDYDIASRSLPFSGIQNAMNQLLARNQCGQYEKGCDIAFCSAYLSEANHYDDEPTDSTRGVPYHSIRDCDRGRMIICKNEPYFILNGIRTCET